MVFVCVFSGQYYYLNEATGETSWDPPADVGNAEPPKSPAAKSGRKSPKKSGRKSKKATTETTTSPWQKVLDEESGRFSVGVCGVPRSQKCWNQIFVDLACGHNLCDNLCVCFVGNVCAGQYYYHNEATGETSWDPPP